MTRQEQGDLGEISAAEWFVSQGVRVALLFGHNSDWDLLAELDGRLLRVQVKTSSFQRKGRWILGGPKYERYEVDGGRRFAPPGLREGEPLESAFAPGGAPELESRARL